MLFRSRRIEKRPDRIGASKGNGSAIGFNEGFKWDDEEGLSLEFNSPFSLVVTPQSAASFAAAL